MISLLSSKQTKTKILKITYFASPKTIKIRKCVIVMKLKLQDTSEFNVATSSLHALSNSMALTRSDKQSPHSSPRLTRRSITPNVNSTVSIGQTTNDIYTKVRFVIQMNIFPTHTFYNAINNFGMFSLFHFP